MNRKNGKSRILAIILVSMLFLIGGWGRAEAQKKPVSGDKFRIGYLEPWTFWAFPAIMDATNKALAELGWENRIEYPVNAQISIGEGTDNPVKLQAAAKKLMQRTDLDLVIVAGTFATAAVLKENNNKTPILAIGVSDPLKSGFIKSSSDSGVDNFTARVEIDRFKRMFAIFHDVVGFKKLGLMHYEDTVSRQFANVDDALAVAKDRGFEVVLCKNVRVEDGVDGCLNGLNWLFEQKMDAFFIPALNCFDWSKADVKKLMDFLNQKKIPTFAREGTKYVKSGSLMGFSSIDFTSRGRFVAGKIIRIFQGEKPRDLPLEDNAIPKISFNLKVAERIGFDPSFDILASTDELFQEITLPDDRAHK